MKNLRVLGGELELIQRRQRAAIGEVPGPAALGEELHQIPFTVGEQVIDAVTGELVEVLGSGVANVETSA
jgi:hypothetical protein